MKIMLLNALLWVISHLPVFCISDDKNFSTIKYCGKDSNKTPHYRISLFSIMLGEVIYFFISLDMDETKIKLGTHRNLYYKLKLSEIEGFINYSYIYRVEFAVDVGAFTLVDCTENVSQFAPRKLLPFMVITVPL